MNPNILIISDKVDPHAEIVMDHLERNGARVFRLLASELLRTYKILCEFNKLAMDPFLIEFSSSGGHNIRSSSIDAVYYRRREKVRPYTSIEDKDARKFIAQETEENFRDLLETIPGYWLTAPSILRRSQSKILQLKTAQEVGLNVPKTIWSNDPDEISSFTNDLLEMIVKPISTVQYYLESKPHTVWATKVSRDFLLENYDSLSKIFSIYQEYIPKRSDIRVTIVGNKIFTCEMITPEQSKDKADWRVVPEELEHKVHTLPDDLCKKLLKFNEKLNMDFGAIDLIRTPSDEYYFLESNVNGQWLWVEKFTGLPISKAIAEQLLNKE